MVKLHLGCGENYKEGFINVDDYEEVKADVYHNLNKFPYPFEENSIDYILIEQTFEHLDEPIKVLEEFYRICKDKAIVEIKVPHISFFFAYHITHKHQFSRNYFNIFEGEVNPHCTSARFKLISNNIKWTNRKCLKALNDFFSFIINKVLKTKKLDIYERFFCWIFPSEEITFVLEVQKR